MLNSEKRLRHSIHRLILSLLRQYQGLIFLLSPIRISDKIKDDGHGIMNINKQQAGNHEVTSNAIPDKQTARKTRMFYPLQSWLALA